MDISIQIKTIFFSIIFGYLFSIMISLNYKYLIKNKIINIFITIIVILISTIIYFLLLKRINNGIFHNYEIICIVFGYTLENLIHKLNNKGKNGIIK